MGLIQILELVFFIAIPIVVLALAVLFGWKRNIYQAGAKIAMTIVSIAVSLLIVKLCTPGILSNFLPAFSGVISEDILAYLSTSTVAKDVTMLVSCLVMPTVFFAVYLLISIIFLLLYLIPGRLLSNKAFAKRAAKTEVPAENLDDEQNNSSPEENVTTINDCRKTWLKAGTVACSVISSFLVLAFLALPISYYSGAIVSVGEMALQAEESELTDVVNIAKSISSYPTNIIYKPFNGIGSGILDRFKTSSGEHVSAVKTVCDLMSFSQNTSDFSADALSPEMYYTLADQLEKNAFINCVATGFAVDMVQFWRQGDAFLGVEPLDAGSPELTELIYSTLSDCEDFPTVLRLLGDVLSLQKVMQPDAEDRGDTLYQVFMGANPGNTEVLKNMLTSDAVSTILPSTEAYGTLLNSVLLQVIAIKEDSDMAETEKSVILQQEAKALIVVIDMVNDPENMQAESLIGAVLDSSVLTSTIQEITHNSTVKDPLGIAGQLPPQFAENVGQILANEGIAENTELHNAFMALITTG